MNQPPRFQDLPLGVLRDLAEDVAVVAAAADVGLFPALRDGPLAADEVARRLELAPRAVGILLPVLVELGLLERDDEAYVLTERARRTLADPGAEAYVGGGLPLWLRNLRAFTRLPESLRSGEPLEEPDDRDDPEALARFMAAMSAAPAARVRRLVDLCLERRPGAARVLDLGGGPGHMSREFAGRGLDVVLFDRPETVAFVEDEYGLADEPGIRTVGGDFLEDPLPDGPFDVVLLSNVLHIYSPARNRDLLRKVAGVVPTGGICAIADFVRGRSPRAPRFALVMLLRTEGGSTYSEEQHAAWLREAGFVDPELSELDAERQLVTAVRS